MKRPILYLAFACTAAIASSPTTSQSNSGAPEANAKHVMTTDPNGRGRFEFIANTIDRDWTSHTVHLKGNARVEIWAQKNPPNTIVLRADEIDYREDTGDVSPRGNVHLTLEELK